MKNVDMDTKTLTFIFWQNPHQNVDVDMDSCEQNPHQKKKKQDFVYTKLLWISQIVNKTKAKTDTIDTIACHCREEKPLICIKAPLFSSFFFVWAWTPTHLHLYLDKTLTKSIDVGMDSCEQNPQQKNKNFFLSTPNFSILISQVVDYIKAKTFWYHCL